MPNIKSLGWVSLGVSGIVNFNSYYSCWTPHYDTTGVALHNVTAAGLYSIAYLDTIGLQWLPGITQGSGAAVAPQTFPPNHPWSGNIVNKNTRKPLYVWSVDGGPGSGDPCNVFSTPAPGSADFGKIEISSVSIPEYVNGSLIDDPNSPSNLSWSLGLSFDMDPLNKKARILFRSRSSSGSPTSSLTMLTEFLPGTQEVGDILAIGPGNVWPVAGAYCCPQRAQAFLGLTSCYGFMFADYNSANLFNKYNLIKVGNPVLSGSLFTTNAGNAPFTGIQNFNSGANLFNTNLQPFQLTSFDNTIFALTNGQSLIGENFVSPTTTSPDLFWFNRDMKYLFPIIEPLPAGSGEVIHMNVGTNAFAIDLLTSEVWVLSIESTEIDALYVNNMSRLRSE